MKLVLLILATVAEFGWILYVGANFLVDRINPIPSSYIGDFFVPAGIPAVLLMGLWYWYFKSR